MVSGGKGGIISTVIGTILIITGSILIVGSSGSGSPIGVNMVAAGVGMVLSGIASMFIRTPSTDMSNSSTYSWDGIQNIIGEGSTIPIVYGEHRVGGVIIEGYLDGTNDNGVSDTNYL